MPQPDSARKVSPAGAQGVAKKDYLFLASLIDGRERGQRMLKRDPHGDALRSAGEMYEDHEYVSAYKCFTPVYAKVVADMQRILARNPEFEANKLSTRERKSLVAAKEHVQKMKSHAQQVIDQFDKLRQDLERKPLVRHHIQSASRTTAPTTQPPPQPPTDDAPPTTVDSADETHVQNVPLPALEIVIAGRRYHRAPYAPPVRGSLYAVRDKTKGERIIRVIAASPDGTQIQVEALKEGQPAKLPLQIAVDSLARQAAKGWCSLLLPGDDGLDLDGASAVSSQSSDSDSNDNVLMRLDIQNFSRSAADIARANIKFDTQLIKDIADGPFRAGNYEQAFITFEQITVGFTSAVAASRRTIADGRRDLVAQKGKLSGKEIEERKAAFVRSEQLISTAERSFTTILEGLRMYLRSAQG